jgi:hypothetical protein
MISSETEQRFIDLVRGRRPPDCPEDDATLLRMEGNVFWRRERDARDAREAAKAIEPIAPTPLVPLMATDRQRLIASILGLLGALRRDLATGPEVDASEREAIELLGLRAQRLVGAVYVSPLAPLPPPVLHTAEED